MHIAAEAGRPEAALVFMKKGVPLHMSNKVKVIHLQVRNELCVIV